jgi:hypothetical protein
MTTTPPPAIPAGQPETELSMAERRWADEHDCTCPTVGAGHASDCPTHGTATTGVSPTERPNDEH